MDQYFKVNAVLSKFSKNYMELKKNLPIRPSEMGVLNIITGTEGMYTPVILAEMLGVSKPMITAHITSLERKGYIEKEPSEQDKRAYYILPTEKARTLVKNVKEDMSRQIDRLINGLGSEEFDALVRLVDKANHILENKGE